MSYFNKFVLIPAPMFFFHKTELQNTFTLTFMKNFRPKKKKNTAQGAEIREVNRGVMRRMRAKIQNTVVI